MRAVALSMILALASLVAAPGCDAKPPGTAEGERAWDMKSLRQAVLRRSGPMAERAVREFLQRGRNERLLERSASLLQAAGSVKAASARFSTVGGWVVDVTGPGFGAEVSVRLERVVGFTVSGANGPLWLSAQRERDSTGELVSIQDARKVALNFLRTYFGPKVLDGMKEYSPPTEEEPIADFCWALKDWGSEVHWGIAWEEVWVDRHTATVVKYAHREQIPDKKPRVSAERARQVASQFLAAEGDQAEILGQAYLPCYLPDGGVRYLWAVRYRKEIVGPVITSLDDLYVDAMTAEVVPDPAWLGTSDEMYRQSEERVRAVTEKMKKQGG